MFPPRGYSAIVDVLENELVGETHARRVVSHLDSFWYRGKPELGNGH